MFTNSQPPLHHSRALLVIAHPGHELRVHNWLETARPEVWVLTDGSGRSNQSRIDSTTRVLEAAGSVSGAIYGELSDVQLYDLVLNFDYGVFTRLVDRLANVLATKQIDFIAGDAEEGYNPTHDICRLIINAAVKLANRNCSTNIRNCDFTLMGPPNNFSTQSSQDSLVLVLDEPAFARKLSAARNYPELQAEVAASLSGTDHEAFRNDPELALRVRSAFGITDLNDFRVECLRTVNQRISVPSHEPPFYEVYGERQVKAGHYKQVLRYQEHVLPLALALDTHVERNSG